MGWMTTVQEWGKSLNNNWMPTVREWGKSLSDKAAVVSNAVAALNNNLTIKR